MNQPDISQAIRDRAEAIRSMATQLADLATVLEVFIEAREQAMGTDTHELAALRDDVDLELSDALGHLESLVRVRAKTSRSLDLLVDAASRARGDAHDALQLMDRFHAVYGEERDSDGETLPETLPDQFLWDLYHRVAAINALADKFPEYVRHAARQMHGWPMIVSHHLDHAGEFKRIAGMVQLGDDYPLNVSPRRKRGGLTPILSYLEPLVWRLHVMRKILAETEQKRGGEDFASRIKYVWWSRTDDPPGPEILAILRNVPGMPAFSKASAAEWSNKIIVPYIVLCAGSDPASSEEPFIRNTWAHRSVKSMATFSSRLHSAVTGFLQRYGRPD